MESVNDDKLFIVDVFATFFQDFLPWTVYNIFVSHLFGCLYIYHFSYVLDFSSEKYIGSTEHRYSWYQQRTYR